MPTVLKAGEILFLPYNEAGILSDDFLITSSQALKKVRAITWNEFRMNSPANSLTESSFFAIHSFKFGMVYTSLRQVHLHTHLHINDPNVNLFVCLSFLLILIIVYRARRDSRLPRNLRHSVTLYRTI